MRDASIKIRTLGRKSGAAILSIGAVFFDRKTGKMGSEFYQEIGIKSALVGSALALEEMKWWSEHSDECKRLIECGSTTKTSLATALDHMATWMRAQAAGVPVIWTYGAGEVAILEEAYKIGAVGLTEPWHYSNVRSVLTLVDVLSVAAPKYIPHIAATSPNSTDTALDAAKKQATLIYRCLVGVMPNTRAPVKATTADEDDEL